MLSILKGSNELLVCFHVLKLLQLDFLDQLGVLAGPINAVHFPVVVEALQLLEEHWVEVRAAVCDDLLAAREQTLRTNHPRWSEEDVKGDASNCRVHEGMGL